MLGSKDLASVAQTIKPAAAHTATATGASVDLAPGFERALVIVDAGTVTDGSHVIKLQESDDNSTFTDVDAGDLDGAAPTLASANDDQVFTFGYVGTKRYIRAVSTVTGATFGRAGMSPKYWVTRRFAVGASMSPASTSTALLGP